ncbi:hypothetical protein KKD19_05570 [Patescibacteria group bacterium]|nr:hypothetical protein [Patescibacteria group bacterium]MBU4512674.1 hypothetical protein [Patescibacteria group bacterium]MCG2693577.1 hypothetical protein [Candidatus Parcubacteria bacterium]
MKWQEIVEEADRLIANGEYSEDAENLAIAIGVSVEELRNAWQLAMMAAGALFERDGEAI